MPNVTAPTDMEPGELRIFYRVRNDEAVDNIIAVNVIVPGPYGQSGHVKRAIEEAATSVYRLMTGRPQAVEVQA